MAVADEKRNNQGSLRKMVLPAAVGVAGGLVGFVVNKQRGIRDSMPDIKKIGVGDLADDLRDKLDVVLGKGDESRESEQGSRPQVPEGRRSFDRAEFEARRRERRERRAARRGR